MLDSSRHDVIFPGWDSGDPGTPAKRSIWVYGIEPGGSDNLEHALSGDMPQPENEDVANYSVRCQWDLRKWPFNRKAHMLIATIEGMPVNLPTFAEDVRSYAEAHKIFARDCEGYFKGNLFPQMNIDTRKWSEAAKARTGFDSRNGFYDFFRNYQQNLHEIILRHRPRLFIGVGAGHAQDFAKIVFGEAVAFESHRFTINGHGKQILLKKGEIPLAIVPHLTGGSNGLNSTEAIITAARIIRAELLESR